MSGQSTRIDMGVFGEKRAKKRDDGLVVTLRETDVIDPTVFDCNKMKIKTNKMKEASMQFVLGAVMKKLDIGIHFASRNSESNSPSGTSGSFKLSTLSAARDNIGSVENAMISKKGKRQANPLFGYRF